MIELLSVSGEHLSRYWVLSFTLYMVLNINVNVNNDLCFTLSCELVGWPTIAKSQVLEIVYHAHSGSVEGVVGEGESVGWGGSLTKGEVHKRKLTNKIFFHSDFLTSLSSFLTPLFFTIIKLVLRLTNKIVLCTLLTYVEPYQNILEHLMFPEEASPYLRTHLPYPLWSVVKRSTPIGSLVPPRRNSPGCISSQFFWSCKFSVPMSL